MGLMESLMQYMSQVSFSNGSEVMILTDDKSYLTSWGKESCLIHTTMCDERCNFTIEMPALDRIHIKTVHGNYLSCEKEDVISQAPEAGEKETFYPIQVSDSRNKFCLKTYNGRYLCSKYDFQMGISMPEEVTQTCYFELHVKYGKSNSLF